MEIKKFLEKMTVDPQHTKLVGYSKSSSKREIHSIKCLHSLQREISNNLTLCFMKLEKKKEQTKPKVSRRKEVTNIRTEMSEIETRKTTKKVNEANTCFFGKINKINRPYLDKEKGKSQLS